jgi:hypothetical protein
MATTHIPVTKTAEYAGTLTALVAQTWALHQQTEKVKEIMDTMIDSVPDPDDYTLLESKFGLGAGDGQTTYNLVVGVLGQSNATGVLNDASLQQLRQRLG